MTKINAIKFKKRIEEPPALTIELDQYQTIAGRTDQNAESKLDGLAFPLLGLFGEVGTLLSALKKKRRDKNAFVG
jgi:hypothetical protein